VVKTDLKGLKTVIGGLVLWKALAERALVAGTVIFDTTSGQ